MTEKFSVGLCLLNPKLFLLRVLNLCVIINVKYKWANYFWNIAKHNAQLTDLRTTVIYQITKMKQTPNLVKSNVYKVYFVYYFIYLTFICTWHFPCCIIVKNLIFNIIIMCQFIQFNLLIYS